MKFSELIEHCSTCIKEFNPVIKTIDSHADDYIARVSPQNLLIHVFLSDYLTHVCSSRTLTRKSSSNKSSTVAPDTKNSSR